MEKEKPFCSDGNFLTGVTEKYDGSGDKFCIKNMMVGEFCAYLRVSDGYRRCVYYEKDKRYEK